MKTTRFSAGRLMAGMLCAAAALLLADGAQAQNLFVSNYTSTGPVYEFTPDGGQSTYVSGLPYSEGVAFDSAGDLFVGMQNNGDIYEYTPGGSRQTFATGLNGPWGMAFNSSGVMFEADGDSGHIYKISASGQKTTFASGLDYPLAVAFNNQGDLFESDWGSGNIYEFAPNGTRTTFASGITPDGLAFDASGDLFDADITSGNIYEFVNNNGILNSTPIVFASGLNHPLGLAFNSAGDLFESDFGTGNIYEFTPDGTKSTFASGLPAPGMLAFEGLALPVPEPSTLWLLAVGTAAAFIYLCQKKPGYRI